MIDITLYKTSTCSWCDMQAAVLDRIKFEFPDANIRHVRITSAEHAEQLGIETVPTTVIEVGGSEKTLEGFTDYEEVVAKIWPNRR